MSDAPPTDVIVVNWNGRRYLPACLDSVARSRIRNRTIVVDNASTDGSVEYLRSERPKVSVVALEANAGYAGGANAGLAAGEAPYALVMNPDVVLAPDYLARVVRRMEADRRIGAAQGKLLAVTPEDFRLDPSPAARRLDSAGHAIRRSRMVVDRGQGSPDGPEYDEEASVFSACGAALVLRRELLADLSAVGGGEGEWFAEDFFAYKEDIDLCWRARLLGWDVRYIPSARAWHARGWAARGRPERSVSGPARRHSWKNHYLLMIRNDRLRDWLRHLPWILGWEAVRIGYALLRDPGRLAGYADLAKAAPAAFRARRQIRHTRRAEPTAMRGWFGSDARSVVEVEE